jgi:hypothetical protein
MLIKSSHWERSKGFVAMSDEELTSLANIQNPHDSKNMAAKIEIKRRAEEEENGNKKKERKRSVNSLSKHNENKKRKRKSWQHCCVWHKMLTNV